MPTTTASSTSQSVFVERLGIKTVSFGPTSVPGDFMNKTGSSGGVWPSKWIKMRSTASTRSMERTHTIF